MILAGRLDADDGVVGVHPNSQNDGGAAGTFLNLNFTIVELEHLGESRALSQGGGLYGYADFPDFHQALITADVLVPSVSLANVEDDVTIRLAPNVQADFAIAERHGLRGSGAGFGPSDVAGVERRADVELCGGGFLRRKRCEGKDGNWQDGGQSAGQSVDRAELGSNSGRDGGQ